MSDSKYKYGQEGKKIVFHDTDKRHAELLIRLRHDGLTQVAFFQSMITGYLKNDKRIIGYITSVKESIAKQGKQKISKTKDLIEKGYELENMFNLTEEEKEKIFDMLAEEFPDL